MSDDDDFDEVTPIGSTPSLDGMDRRLRETLKAVQDQGKVLEEQGKALKVCVDDTKATRNELTEHRKHDEDALAAIHKEQGGMRSDLKSIAHDASTAKGALGGMTIALDLLVADVNARRKIDTEHALAVIRVDETGQKLKLEDGADAKKSRRGLFKKLLGGIITLAVGAAAGYFGLGGGG